MDIDPWILTFSALTVLVTVWMGFWSAKRSKTASDFFVAGRSVSVGWNASAISGEYLSAASFMGVAGMVMSSGYDALWYPVCYACGYLFLLLFIAGPLRRFGAYTIPDFAEGRFDSPLFRKIAVVFVLFIGFFYTMPQMSGAGKALSYIFQDLDFRGTPLAFLAPHDKGQALKGLHYGVGVFVVGALITLNVALGGMKGITLVQAFQYWAKMFAISVPVFVLMAVYGHYGKQIEINAPEQMTSDFPPMLAGSADTPRTYRKRLTIREAFYEYAQLTGRKPLYSGSPMLDRIDGLLRGRLSRLGLLKGPSLPTNQIEFISHEGLAFSPAVGNSNAYGITMSLAPAGHSSRVAVFGNAPSGAVARALSDHYKQYVSATKAERAFDLWKELNRLEVELVEVGNQYLSARKRERPKRQPLPAGAPLLATASLDNTWLATSGSTNSVPVSTSMSLTTVNGWATLTPPSSFFRAEERLKSFFGAAQHYSVGNAKLASVLLEYTQLSGRTVVVHTNVGLTRMLGPLELNWNDWSTTIATLEGFLKTNGFALRDESASTLRVMLPEQAILWDQRLIAAGTRQPLPAKAPRDETWLNPFGPLTTKAAKAAAGTISERSPPLSSKSRLLLDRAKQKSPAKFVFKVNSRGESDFDSAGPDLNYTVFNDRKGDFGREAMQRAVTNLSVGDTINAVSGNEGYGFGMQVPVLHYGAALHLLAEMKGWRIAAFEPQPNLQFNISGYGTRNAYRDGLLAQLATNGIVIERLAGDDYLAFPAAEKSTYEPVLSFLTGLNSSRSEPDPQRAWLAKHEKPLALLYTYSLIIALVCGTAGLPHILVRFYTNPDGVAAKRTTMWVMILIGVFYLFPPVFGVMGRNLMPDLYNGLAGVKGTDGIVLKLPKLLNERFGVLGSVLSGVTCAGAFAAFMSTFSGLLVSMTGALAHDVYGRILRPKSTPDARLKMFKLCAVLVGAGAMLLGFLVESFEINKMVGWAFAIAATSYFPLLFLSTWWRGITMKGAATGMLVGGTLSLVAIASTMFADQAAWAAGLKDYYAAHPLLRILAEQPAIWALPLALGLMFFISRLTTKDVPADIRMKMLVLHAPEKLGLKQEYIQEHQHGHE